MRILLAEDDRMIAEALCAHLRDSHYTVDWVNNGNTATTALASQSYDLLLLDLGLPERDGLNVLQYLRRQQNLTPVLILTARDDIDSRIAGLDGGADDYIVKPFDMAELKARIRAVLRRHNGQAALKPSNGIITLHPDTSEAEIVGQAQTITLSKREFALLLSLIHI